MLITFTPTTSIAVHSSDNFNGQTPIRLHLAALITNVAVPWMLLSVWAASWYPQMLSRKVLLTWVS